MPLADVGHLLAQARRRKVALGAFNVFNLETIDAVLAAATAARLPVLVSVTEKVTADFDRETLAMIVRARAASLPIPIGLHLDHSQSEAGILKAIRAGFTSVMYDGQGIPHAEKIRRTRAIVDMAHAVGVLVEAELDHIPRRGDPAEAGLTDPRLAGEFVERTGVDLLAVAIGSVHALTERTARLDLARLRAIRRQTGAYLTLHGGSGVPDAEIRRAIREGITKISVFTRASRAASEAIRDLWRGSRETPRYADLARAARAAFQAEVADRLAVFSGRSRRIPR
jgi:fructose-bisphosphate aldolase class II